jgi:hypothetical protein
MSYYLSIVLCGRNDNYGGNYLKRLQTLINCLDYFCAENALSCQVVFVEWNPPADRPPIKSVINWGKHLGVKVVRVPGAVDSRLPANRGRSGLHEFVAKNAGIRRAEGRFVLCCNSDLIFSPELFQYLARRDLRTDAVYRTTRVNVRVLPDAVPASEAPRLCRQEAVSVDMIGGRYAMNAEMLERLTVKNILSIRGFDLMLREMYDFALDPDPVQIDAALLRHFPHCIHINAAGDFTLLSREGWLKHGGYLENDCRNHVDAWFCFRAAQMGFAQVILPLRMCIYHQEHGGSSLRPFEETITHLSRQTQNPKWGLADENLGVEIIQAGAGEDPSDLAWATTNSVKRNEYSERSETREEFCWAANMRGN